MQQQQDTLYSYRHWGSGAEPPRIPGGLGEPIPPNTQALKKQDKHRFDGCEEKKKSYLTIYSVQSLMKNKTQAF